MPRPPTLTTKQMQWIDDHPDLFPASIRDHPEFPQPGVSRQVIRAYQVRTREEKEETKTNGHDQEKVDSRRLADDLNNYIARYGLPSKFHGATGVLPGYVGYLEGKGK